MPNWSAIQKMPQTDSYQMPPDLDPLPKNWPERKAWLQNRFEHLDPDVQLREIEFHRLAFERGPSHAVLRGSSSSWAPAKASGNFSAATLANPKSGILTFPEGATKIFADLMSR